MVQNANKGKVIKNFLTSNIDINQIWRFLSTFRDSL